MTTCCDSSNVKVDLIWLQPGFLQLTLNRSSGSNVSLLGADLSFTIGTNYNTAIQTVTDFEKTTDTETQIVATFSVDENLIAAALPKGDTVLYWALTVTANNAASTQTTLQGTIDLIDSFPSDGEIVLPDTAGPATVVRYSEVDPRNGSTGQALVQDANGVFVPTTLTGGGSGDYDSADFAVDLAAAVASGFSVSVQASLALADSSLQVGSNVSALTNDAGYTTFDGAYGSLSGIPATFTPSVHNQAWNTITSTPTTLAGYGITDAISADATATDFSAGIQASLALADSALQPGDSIPQSDVTNLTTDLAAKADLVGGVIPTSQIPAIALSEYCGNVADEADLVALTVTTKGNPVGPGDWATRTDRNSAWFLTDDDQTNIANWVEIPAPGNPVTEVNGQGGPIVNLGSANVGADPAGTASNAITAHEAAADPHSQYFQDSEAGALASLDDITDAQVAAGAAIAQSKIAGLVTTLDSKAPLNSPGFSGTPTAPTPATTVSTTQIATTAMVQAIKNEIFNDLRIKVGDLYLSTDATDPATRLGYGTWEIYAAGRALVGVDSGDTDFDAAGKLAGSKTHTLTEAELPQLDIEADYWNGTGSGRYNTIPNVMSIGGTIVATGTIDTIGGGQAHSILQPSIAVHIWRRTA